MPNFDSNLNSLSRPFTFDRIIEAAACTMSRGERKGAYRDLGHGVEIIDSDGLLDKYLVAYGQMHVAKLNVFFRDLRIQDGTKIQIVDWGCGQGLATAAFLDFFRNRYDICSIRLLEASDLALDRALRIARRYGVTDDVKGIKWEVERKLEVTDFEFENGVVTVHLFSNILDIGGIDLENVAELMRRFGVLSPSHLVAVGPCNKGSVNIDSLLAILGITDVTPVTIGNLPFNNSYSEKKSCSCYGVAASYGLPVGRSFLRSKVIKASKSIEKDDSLVPEVYEIGACSDVVFAAGLSLPAEWFKYELVSDGNRLIYNNAQDSAPSYLAVLNNIVARGAPTRAGILIEDYLVKELGLTHRVAQDHVIEYESVSGPLMGVSSSLFDAIDSTNKLQRLIAIPILVSRIQHAVLRGALAGVYDITKPSVSVLACERDFECVQIALDELSQMLENIAGLMCERVACPKFDVFKLTDEVYEDKKQIFDILLDVSLNRDEEDKNLFGVFKGRFSYGARIRGAKVQSTSKGYQLVTGANIVYRPLCEKTSDGRYVVIEEHAKHLRYFLRNIFRKSDFRPGQLPILNRALQLKSVIGLLPTGGGKSLTYQLAGMMQPGMVFVVDPIKSLMKDQVDGLIKNGISTCAYINSSLKDEELRLANEKILRGRCKFLFVSPERLAIPSFRWLLRELYENRLFFSYGVVDEVHCVSEWGHDFRFAYLHLGRNLHTHVRCKNAECVPLFGLTATASFDVLADVERELSGAYAYRFDPEVVVRYENTNRLELQYRVCQIRNPKDGRLKENENRTRRQLDRADAEYQAAQHKKVSREELACAKNSRDTADKYHKDASDCRRYAVYDDKLNEIVPVIASNYRCFKELNKEDAIKVIKERFLERENISGDSEYGRSILQGQIRQDLSREAWTQPPFSSAGLVFCPYKGFKKNPDGTFRKWSPAVSVQRVYDVLSREFSDGVVRYFSGSIDGDDGFYDNIMQNNQDDYINNRAGLMVATSAFGLGIDKPNIRFVVEVNHPSSLESFVQEAGRAGRDRKMALATMVVSEADDVDEEVVRRFHENNFIGEKEEKKELLNLFGSIKMFVDDESSELDKSVMLSGFLNKLLSIPPGNTLHVMIPYQQPVNRDGKCYKRQELIDKLVYRLACIGVVRDIECLYLHKGGLRDLCLTMVRLEDGGYYAELKQFLLRYFNETRVEKEMGIVRNHRGDNEIHKCIGYLTEFVYNHIEKKTWTSHR